MPSDAVSRAVADASSVIDVAEARARLRPYLRRTPLVEVETVAGQVWLKLENLQLTGSFKIRGAMNALLRAGSPEKVVAASGGNHGLAVAVAARMLGARASIFVPRSTPPSKIALIRAADADLRIEGEIFDESYVAARTFAESAGVAFVPSFDSAAVVEGQGTVAAEIVEDLADVESIAVSAGGGGLAAGLAVAAPDRQVVAVEPAGCCSVARGLAAGRPVESTTDSVASDALGSRFAGRLPLRILLDHRVRSVLVSEAEIVAAQQQLWDEFRIAAEPAAAVTFAAWCAGRIPGRRVCLVVCGANGAAGAPAAGPPSPAPTTHRAPTDDAGGP